MKLQDYLYLETDHHTPLGWVKNEEQFLGIIDTLMQRSEHEPLTYKQSNVGRYVFRTVQDYYLNPTDNRMNVRYAVKENADGVFYIEPMKNEWGNDYYSILAVFSPMMFKGLECGLAIINLTKDVHVYINRYNENEAIPLRAYIALLKNDAESVFTNGRPDLGRRYGARPVLHRDTRLRLIIKNGEQGADLRSLTKQDIKRALAKVGTVTNIETDACLRADPFSVQLEPKCDAFLDAVEQIQREVRTGVITTARQTAWQHIRNGNIFIGSYPNSHGYHERVCERVGTIYPNIVSEAKGVVLQFHNNDCSYMIVRE